MSSETAVAIDACAPTGTEAVAGGGPGAGGAVWAGPVGAALARGAAWVALTKAGKLTMDSSSMAMSTSVDVVGMGRAAVDDGAVVDAAGGADAEAEAEAEAEAGAGVRMGAGRTATGMAVGRTVGAEAGAGAGDALMVMTTVLTLGFTTVGVAMVTGAAGARCDPTGPAAVAVGRTAAAGVLGTNMGGAAAELVAETVVVGLKEIT